MPAVIELGRPRTGVVRHRSRLLKGSAVLKIGCDPCRPETVVADFRPYAGRGRAPANHGIGVRLGQRRAGKRPGAASDCAEQRSLRIILDAGAGQILMQIDFEVMVARHRVRLAALLV